MDQCDGQGLSDIVPKQSGLKQITDEISTARIPDGYTEPEYVQKTNPHYARMIWYERPGTHLGLREGTT